MIAISVVFGAVFGAPIVLAAPAQVAPDVPSRAVPFRFDKPAGTCVVLPGDNLTVIAHRYLVAGGWPEIYHRNAEMISDPDLIYPGQRLTLR